MSPGTVDVNAVFSAITVTAPSVRTDLPQGAALDVAWKTNAVPAGGEFSVWVVSPANGWYVGKIVPAAARDGLHQTRSSSTCPPRRATASSSTTAPPAAIPGASTA